MATPEATVFVAADRNGVWLAVRYRDYGVGFGREVSTDVGRIAA